MLATLEPPQSLPEILIALVELFDDCHDFDSTTASVSGDGAMSGFLHLDLLLAASEGDWEKALEIARKGCQQDPRFKESVLSVRTSVVGTGQRTA